MLKAFLIWLTTPVLILMLILWIIKEPYSLLEFAIFLLIVDVIFLFVHLLINWIVTLPRRSKIKKLFPLVSTDLSDEQVKFLLRDLVESIYQYENEPIDFMRIFRIRHFEKINRGYSLLESLRYRNISESDIQELNAMYGFHPK